MAGWLQKISARAANAAKGRNLPALLQGKLPAGQRQTPFPQKLPNASVIYGIAASLLGVIGVYFLFTGRWFTGLLVLFLAVCFFGFAMHFIRHAR